MWFDDLLLFIFLSVILIIIIIPFPKYWAKDQEEAEEHAEGDSTRPNTVNQLIEKYRKYTHIPSILNQPLFGFINRIVGICLPKRVEQFTQRIKAVGLYDSTYIFDAVVGAKLDFMDVFSSGFRSRGTRTDHRGQTETGCALSHYCVLYDFFHTTNDQYMLVLEDDLQQPTQQDMAILEKVISELEQTQVEFDLFYLSYCSEKKVIEKKEDIKKARGSFKYIWKMNGTFTTGAYIVSRPGAQKILARLCPIKLPIDNYLRLWTIDGSFITYGSILRIFNQDKTMKSSIGNDQDPYVQFEKLKYIISYKDLMDSLRT